MKELLDPDILLIYGEKTCRAALCSGSLAIADSLQCGDNAFPCGSGGILAGDDTGHIHVNILVDKLAVAADLDHRHQLIVKGGGPAGPKDSLNS